MGTEEEEVNMSWQVGLILFIAAIILAVTALSVRDLLATVFVISAYSFIMALLYAEMGAVDVSITEAAIGAGLSGLFLIATLFHLKRRSED